MRRHMKEVGIEVSSNDAVQKYQLKAQFPSETGKLTMPDPKKKGRFKTGAYWRILPRVDVVLDMLQTIARQQQEAGLLRWRSNQKAQQVWVCAMMDKGGESYKLCLKWPMVEHADSAARTTLLVLMDGVPDNYAMVKAAAGPIFEVLNIINRWGFALQLEWTQELPPYLELRSARPRCTSCSARAWSYSTSSRTG